MATTTRPQVQGHAIFNVVSHNGDNNKALCTSGCHFNNASNNGNNNNKKMAATTPYVNYKPLVQKRMSCFILCIAGQKQRQQEWQQQHCFLHIVA
jgi:hypothetical protein